MLYTYARTFRVRYHPPLSPANFSHALSPYFRDWLQGRGESGCIFFVDAPHNSQQAAATKTHGSVQNNNSRQSVVKVK